MLDGTCKNTAAVSDSARAIANGIFELVDDLRVIQNVVAIRSRMVRFVQDFVALRIDNIKLRQCIAMHGTCDKTHIVRVFRFYKYNSKFTHNQKLLKNSSWILHCATLVQDDASLTIHLNPFPRISS